MPGELIQAFDIFVGASIRESFGNVFVEAALAGVPVIAAAVDGIPEVVIDGKTGYLLRPKLPIRPSAATGPHPSAHSPWIDGRLSSPRALDPAELAQAILDSNGRS
ncbi:MAG: glycosyltransferase [Candidatus Promineofilum sp.]|nr:glycosyltransferase [Promineifilum sp.]